MSRLLSRLRRPFTASRPAADRPLAGLRVAAIVDDFTRACLEPEVQLLSIDARLWRAQLPMFRPQLLFVESAWRGAGGSWRHRIASYPDRRDDTLDAVLAWFRARDLPTVFWNKEDPVHFDRFAARAGRFDQVFTTEQACVDRYVAECGLPAGRVGTLLFAAQPALHHPGAGPREDVVCFAGSYGEAELGDRRRDLEMLLDGAVDFDLRILDRNWQAAGGAKAYPLRYRGYLRPGVDYRVLAELQRRYKVFLNVNAVRDSRTMFSRRVFEILASGAALVSSPNAGIAELFGDSVALVDGRDAARDAIDRFLHDDAHREAAAARAIARIGAGHTYEHRLRQVCAAVGV